MSVRLIGVRLEADVAPLRAGLDEASQVLGRFDQTAAALADSLGRAGRTGAEAFDGLITVGAAASASLEAASTAVTMVGAGFDTLDAGIDRQVTAQQALRSAWETALEQGSAASRRLLEEGEAASRAVITASLAQSRQVIADGAAETVAAFAAVDSALDTTMVEVSGFNGTVVASLEDLEHTGHATADAFTGILHSIGEFKREINGSTYENGLMGAMPLATWEKGWLEEIADRVAANRGVDQGAWGEQNDEKAFRWVTDGLDGLAGAASAVFGTVRDLAEDGFGALEAAAGEGARALDAIGEAAETAAGHTGVLDTRLTETAHGITAVEQAAIRTGGALAGFSGAGTGTWMAEFEQIGGMIEDTLVGMAGDAEVLTGSMSEMGAAGAAAGGGRS